MTDKDAKLLMQKAKEAARAVWPIVRGRSCAQHLSFDDVVQEGMLQYLEHAEGTFDPTKGKLSNFMYYRLKYFMWQYVLGKTDLKHNKRKEMQLFLSSTHAERTPNSELDITVKNILSTLPERNVELWVRNKIGGERYADLGLEYGISAARVGQIVVWVGKKVKEGVK